MPAVKGKNCGGRRSGAGRKAGTPNRFSADVKAMVLAALNKAGGEEYLLQQAKDNPGPFMALLGKILPTQITGENGGPVQVDIVSLIEQRRKERGI